MTNSIQLRFPACAFLLLLTAPVFAQTNCIDFDSGSVDAAIGSFYACEGVILANAVWATNRDARGEPFAGATGSHVIIGQVNGSSPTAQAPIVARFAAPVSFVSILATDVGTAGARLEAYDAENAGNYLGGIEHFGSGVGFDYYTNLQIVAQGIRRIHLFQPLPNGSDGVVWDNLCYGPVVTSSAEMEISMYAGLRLTGSVGCAYNLQYADDVAGTNWVTLTHLTLTNSPHLWIDLESGTNRHRFYRALKSHP